MGNRRLGLRRVFLDPDGSQPLLFGVILAFPTGVRYEHQCAGTECLQRSLEGYFVPLSRTIPGSEMAAFDPAGLTEVFHRKGGCVWGWAPHHLPPNTPNLPPERLELLRELVAEIPYWTCDEAGTSEERTYLALDDDQLGEIVEAWVPVLTPEGPGVLVWENCD